MHFYELGSHQLPIVASARRKSIAVKQKKEGLVIEVPKNVSKIRLRMTLDNHRGWLLSQIDKFQQLVKQCFSGAPGESFELYGESYHCFWHDESTEIPRKKFDYFLCHESKSLRLRFKAGITDEQKQELTCQAVQASMQSEAEHYLHSKTDEYAQLMALNYQSLTVKGYKSRWGSCYPDGRIQFNWRLMQAPKWVIDYVVVHELAHLVHANHSSNFWQLVETYYPQTQAAKKILKQHGHQWIGLLQN